MAALVVPPKEWQHAKFDVNHTIKTNMSQRFTTDDLAAWRREGGVLLRSFLSSDEVASARDDMALIYADRGQGEGIGTALDLKQKGAIGGFSASQFKNFDDMPFDCSPALNLLALHPAIIDFARAALGTRQVHLYQSHAWAKYTGEADYDQLFHCDYKNHTLTVPSDDERLRTINMMIYLTDVTDGHGAIHFVPQPVSDKIAGEDRVMFPEDELNIELAQHEKSGAGPAGSIFAYGIDVYHRGTNLTVPDGVRYTLTASFRAAGNDMIGWSAWPHSFLKPWHLIFDNATPDQLSCLGIPLPGDPFWTERTLKRTQERWPDWDMSAYRAAIGQRAVS